MRGTLSYLWALMMANMKSHGAQLRRLFVMSFFMMIQNTMFFIIWILFFQSVSDLKGWQLPDYMRLIGIFASSFGFCMFFFYGVRNIAYWIQDGSLDAYITRPRAVLPAVLMSASSPASLGDILYGPILWLTLGGMPLSSLPWFLVLAMMSATLLLSVLIIMYSLSFWLKGSPRFPDQLFEMLLIFTGNILHGQPFALKAVAFTIIPAGFITYIPVQLTREFDATLCALLIGAMIFYGVLAVIVFNAGVRRYVRGAV
ncbi:MAG: ABC-2 family transporter protein [Bdellovibrionales bacterium]|jgi:ABC-2 type transport system permease protein